MTKQLNDDAPRKFNWDDATDRADLELVGYTGHESFTPISRDGKIDSLLGCIPRSLLRC
jgi:hypothetical protein